MAAPFDHVPELQLRDSYVRHAARAQLHRFFGHMRRARDARAMSPDLVTDGFVVPPPVLVGELTECRVNLTSADVIAATAADPPIAATFKRGDDFLPRLVSISIGRAGGAPSSAAAHLVRATIHYFIALVENPARDPEPFRELLADPFSLHYMAKPLTDFDAVRGWVTGRLASVVASEHDIHSVVVSENDDGTANAVVTMKSQALFPDGSGAISRNTQRWTLNATNPGERFPRIVEILIDRDAVEFFGPAPDYEPRPMPG